jgi:hypothetical protein
MEAMNLKMMQVNWLVKKEVFFIRSSFLLSSYCLFFMILWGACLVCTADNPKKQSFTNRIPLIRVEFQGNTSSSCTAILQKALDLKPEKLVVCKGDRPWLINKTLNIPGDIIVEFENGAELKAAAGAFKRVGDCLMKVSSQNNITLCGKGVLTMRKSDYANPNKYKKGEWRHCLSMYNCRNVNIKDLTFQKSGGDGIYLNAVKNVAIENVVVDDNYRQGISVIAAEKLLIQNSVIKNTNGTAPQCGIDFEPNRPSEKIVNCQVVGCRFENNAHSAVNLSLARKDETPVAIDIVVQNCIVKGGNFAFSAMCGSAAIPIGNLKNGRFLIRNCMIEDYQASAFYFQSNRVDSAKIIVENCIVNNAEQQTAPVFFCIRPPAIGEFGGVEFQNCAFNIAKAKQLVEFVSLVSGCRLDSLEGAVVFNGEKVDLQKYIRAQGYVRAPLMLSPEIPLLDIDASSLKELTIHMLPEFWYFAIEDRQNMQNADFQKWPLISTLKHWEKAKTNSKKLHQQLKHFDGSGWYARKIRVSEIMKGRKVYLYLGAVDESAEIYINGKLAGKRLFTFPYNWLFPFAIRIEKYLEWDQKEQEIMIRVTDSGYGGGVWKKLFLIAQ